MMEVSELPVWNVVEFRPPHGPHLEQLIQQKPLSVLLQDEDWDLTVRRFEQMIENGSIQAIKTLRVHSLKVRWGSSQKILPSIRQIHFPCLQHLYLNGNSIRDIQALASLNLNSLQVANLKENNITSLKALRKCTLPSLRELNLYKNNILDFRPLQELKAPQLVCLWIAPQMYFSLTQRLFRGSTGLLLDLQVAYASAYSLAQLTIYQVIVHSGGKNLDFDAVKEMAEAIQPKVELVYRIQDDIRTRLE